MDRNHLKKYPPIFGISSEAHINIVKDVFNTVTDKYDMLNRFLSGRQDVSWRKRAVKIMAFSDTNKFLGIATGTGDLEILCAKKYPDVLVVGVDFLPAMISKGIEKFRSEGLSKRVELIQ